MSLDVYLETNHCDKCQRGEEVFWKNITHNLGNMADAAGIYKAIWRPEDIRITTAAQLVPILSDGLARLISNPRSFKKYAPANGWGDIESLCEFVRCYIEACENNPTARVRVRR